MDDRTTVSEDGVVFGKGDVFFNFYDMEVCTIGEIDSEGWFETTDMEGRRRAYLNGERVCSLEFAKKKGWA